MQDIDQLYGKRSFAALVRSGVLRDVTAFVDPDTGFWRVSATRSGCAGVSLVASASGGPREWSQIEYVADFFAACGIKSWRSEEMPEGYSAPRKPRQTRQTSQELDTSEPVDYAMLAATLKPDMPLFRLLVLSNKEEP